MTSSLRPSTLKPSRLWLYPGLLFFALMIHGSLLGLTDDEAYYWVLAQRPALGYAFHPPTVAWMIAAAQAWLGGIFGTHSSGVVRLPAALCSAGILYLGLRWMVQAGVSANRLGRATLGLVSLAGVFAASWMMVPDLPMFLGWMMIFAATWELCFESRKWSCVLLTLGCALAVLSKYSGILGVASSFFSIMIWAPSVEKRRPAAAMFLGLVIALIPIIVWNSQHEWASILYQIRDRHEGAEFSLKRYGKFWASELLFAGPPLIFFALSFWKRVRVAENQVSRFVAVFALPAFLIFCVQPLWSDFKPHWALIVWLPFALELGWAFSQDLYTSLAKAQVGFGFTVMGISILFCHFPLQSWLIEKWSGQVPESRWDVTNDMYGWQEFARLLPAGLPVIGSRYQTAAQIAFALGDFERVALVPRDLKQRDEWASPDVVDSQGPDWPRLLKPVLFITDNRYDAGPEFKHAKCEKVGHSTVKRGQYIAKSFRLWKCDPIL